MEYIPMLCWLCCSTEPNAIKSLAGVRFSDCGYPSPKYDASATALGGALAISVKIVLDFIINQVARRTLQLFLLQLLSLSLLFHNHKLRLCVCVSFFIPFKYSILLFSNTCAKNQKRNKICRRFKFNWFNYNLIFKFRFLFFQLERILFWIKNGKKFIWKIRIFLSINQIFPSTVHNWMKE